MSAEERRSLERVYILWRNSQLPSPSILTKEFVEMPSAFGRTGSFFCLW